MEIKIQLETIFELKTNATRIFPTGRVFLCDIGDHRAAEVRESVLPPPSHISACRSTDTVTCYTLTDLLIC